VVAAQLQKLSVAYPGLIIYTATIDEAVNSQGFCIAWVRDAGDRAFGTVSLFQSLEGINNFTNLVIHILPF